MAVFGPKQVLVVPTAEREWATVQSTLETLPGVESVTTAQSMVDAIRLAAVSPPDAVVAGSPDLLDPTCSIFTRLCERLGPRGTFTVIADDFAPDQLLVLWQAGVSGYLRWADLTGDVMSSILAALVVGGIAGASQSIRSLLAVPAKELTEQEQSNFFHLNAERTEQQIAKKERWATAEELITMVAHDLRNYLSPLKLRIQLLQRQACQEYPGTGELELRQLAIGVDRIGCLVDDLLDVARLDQGLLTLRKKRIDLAALVHEACAALRTPAQAIDVETPAELVLYGDAERLRQVMHNLLANAVQHSPIAKPVHVTLDQDESGVPPQAVVTVADQGAGIPDELLPHIFDRFRQGPGSTGLGIGLHVASRIATAHGGSLTVDSTAGQGTRFRLAVPLEPPEDVGLPLIV